MTDAKEKPDPARKSASRDREQPSPDKVKRAHREETLDKTLADSYPASDPPSSIPDPGED